MSKPLVPVDARRQDWPRLVANAINRLSARNDECCEGGTTLELDGGDAGGSDGSIEIDGGGA
jgi:hypothetical protein